jgi:hypothetical protein
MIEPSEAGEKPAVPRLCDALSGTPLKQTEILGEKVRCLTADDFYWTPLSLNFEVCHLQFYTAYISPN